MRQTIWEKPEAPTLINTAKDDDVDQINLAIDQIMIQLLKLTRRKQELERKKQERHLSIVK